nr:AAA domain-containing protein [Segatella maculosa]
METSNMILLKGEPKTFQIKSVKKDNRNVFWVTFSDKRTFPYRQRDIVFLSSSVEINVEDSHLTRADRRLSPKRAWVFTHGFKKFYRLEFDNGIREYKDSDLKVEKSVLSDKKALHIFLYLKEVSSVNTIPTETGLISLFTKYQQLNFIEEDCTMATFLKPSLLKVHKGLGIYLFPFRSNRSQMIAVRSAFSSQISVIQGPPGTGKTQTILNIIANIVATGKSVLAVSNNNAAVENVREKLEQVGFGFLVASLGRSEKQQLFIEKGQVGYPDMRDWSLENYNEETKVLHGLNEKVGNVFLKQEQLAQNRLLMESLLTERSHFLSEHNYDEMRLESYKKGPSDRLMKMWLELESEAEACELAENSPLKRLIRFLHKIRRRFLLRIIYSIKHVQDRKVLLADMKALYYVCKLKELQCDIEVAETFLQETKADELLEAQTKTSLALLKHHLSLKYKGTNIRPRFESNDLYRKSDEIAKEYPVVLSTTFSARNTLPGHIFDYLIMDEASQVSVDSAVLALSVARNAVIVGDVLQLSHIVDKEERPNLLKINHEFGIPEAYNCLEQSFLSSVLHVLPHAPQILLREHYRCEPVIIDFCNQKFYGGNLIIMSTSKGGETAMKVVKTVPGNLHRKIYDSQSGRWETFNQRENDELQHLLMAEPELEKDLGVITPYRGQVHLLRRNISNKLVEIDTIHKYQGREKDTIVFSTVLSQYDDFCDNPNLVNVAVSRAKRCFVLITNGNETTKPSVIGDLINYIQYHGVIVESKLHSIFDLLYSSYAQQRMHYLAGKPKVSDYDSENIAYNVLLTILKTHKVWNVLHAFPHYPLYDLIRDLSGLTDKQHRFVASQWLMWIFLLATELPNSLFLQLKSMAFPITIRVRHRPNVML